MSASEVRLKVVLCWHMHQPEYRDLTTGEYRQPWTYLHAVKDYVDMAAILEAVPVGRAVINFVPILLEQIEDYSRQLQQFLSAGTPISDPLLAALAGGLIPREDEARTSLINACLRANRERLVNRFPEYRRLAEMAEILLEDALGIRYVGEQYVIDLLAWYHIAWLGETVRRDDQRVRALIAKGRLFDADDRRELVTVIAELLASVIPRYRRLAEQGRIELSMTPYAHPMVPLLLDFSSAREAIHEMELPSATHYPGGLDRAQWHLRHGLEVFERHFGVRPRGCWPSEGGVSTAAVRLIGEHGFEWVASGGNVLRNSLVHTEVKPEEPVEDRLHRGYYLAENGPACFFRDDGLSDLIGFTYSSWHGDDAVSNLIHHLQNMAEEFKGDGGRVVSIILDGENAWESYPANGYYFLTALYKRLGEHPDFELTTFGECLSKDLHPVPLARLVAGSWVYGTFSTWMGDADKNLGWDLLCEAKQAYDRAIASGNLSAEQQSKAIEQLAACEGSDWFWWFGGYNPAESVSDFEQLYRLHLRNLYRIIDEPVPESLSQVISVGGGQPAQGGVMRPGQVAPA